MSSSTMQELATQLVSDKDRVIAAAEEVEFQANLDYWDSSNPKKELDNTLTNLSAKYRVFTA